MLRINRKDNETKDEIMKEGSKKAPARYGRVGVWVVRAAFTLAFFINIQCVLSFLLHPDAFAPAYELSGIPGRVAIQGLGIAFLMWNATYPAFIVNPRRFCALGAVILAQQVIGLAGEIAIRMSLPFGHTVLAASINRFIAFDAFNLLIMAIAFGIFFGIHKKYARPHP